MRRRPFVTTGSLFLLLGALSAIPVEGAFGQAPAATIARLTAEPTSLSMRAGDTAILKVTAYDASGKAIDEPFVRVSGPRSAVQVSVRTNTVRALAAGKVRHRRNGCR
jgi:hypothetical protein